MSQTQYTVQRAYRCKNDGTCGLVSANKVVIFNDTQPRPIQGNHITPLPYSRTIQSWRPGTLVQYSYKDDSPYVSYYVENYTSFGFSFSEIEIDTLSGRNLKNELISRFQGSVTNLSMMAKDLYDASNMALDYFKRVNRCWKDLKRGNYRKAFKSFSGSRKLSKGMANNWLSFQYGVLPTIRAVQEGFEATNNQRAQTIRLVQTVSGVRRMKPSNSDARHNYYGVSETVTSIRGYRYFTTTDDIRRLLVTNQVEVAWDATPYSFLLDWFVPIGDYLKQFGYSPNLRATTGCNSKLERTSTYGAGSSKDNRGRLLSTQSEVRTDYVRFTREVGSTIVARPSFSETLSQSRIGLTTNRCANAFALLVQRIR
jgi:hypothetical protein